jgi:hypothetical protein
VPLAWSHPRRTSVAAMGRLAVGVLAARCEDDGVMPPLLLLLALSMAARCASSASSLLTTAWRHPKATRRMRAVRCRGRGASRASFVGWSY